MTINFDPKANRLPPAPSENPQVKKEEVAYADPYADPVQTVSDLDILFSGLTQRKELQAQNPVQPIEVPDLNKNILGPMPMLADQNTFGAIVDRYQLLRKNLLDRRMNYVQALEGYLKPDEAFDMIGRIEEIDHALGAVESNLEKAKEWQKANRSGD